jgi:hypothetical protein
LNLQSSHDLALARPKKAVRKIGTKAIAKAG